MKKFRVWGKSVDYCYIDVCANTKEEAIELANEIDAGEFIFDNGYFELLNEDEVEELGD